MSIKERCAKFLSELGVAVTTFCRKVSISTGAYYRWQSGDLNLSAETESRIEQYLDKYGF